MMFFLWLFFSYVFLTGYSGKEVYQITYHFYDKRVDKVILELGDNPAFNVDAMLARKEKDMPLYTDGEIFWFESVSAVFYRNDEKKEMIKRVKIYDSQEGKYMLLNVVYPYQQPKWEITDDRKMLGKYEVIKAINPDNQSVAWFCPDIPVDGGPEFYHGLPGLILKLEKTNGVVYTFKGIKKVEFPIRKPEADETVSSKLYAAMIKSGSK